MSYIWEIVSYHHKVTSIISSPDYRDDMVKKTLVTKLCYETFPIYNELLCCVSVTATCMAPLLLNSMKLWTKPLVMIWKARSMKFNKNGILIQSWLNVVVLSNISKSVVLKYNMILSTGACMKNTYLWWRMNCKFRENIF